MTAKNTLIYVDKNLSIAMAANLVGVMKTVSQTENAKVGFNWLVGVGLDEGKGIANQTDIREMLPEDLVYYFHEKIGNKFGNLDELIPKLSTGTDGSLIPGNIVSVFGKLSFPNFILPTNYSPFEPTEIELKSYLFHGEECIIGELKNENYKIPIYLPFSAKYQIVFSHNQPVEVTGIVKWTPPYSPSGSRSSNLAIRCAILWLR